MLIIKVGGGAAINWDFIAEDLAKLVAKEQVVVVHGAGTKRDTIAQQMNSPTRTVVSPSGISSVFTDQKALEIFLMVYPGLVNKTIVAKLLSQKVKAIGLSGIDGQLWQAKRKSDLLVQEGTKTKLLQNNFTGRVEKINTSLIKLLVDAGYVPVIAPPAISHEYEIVNTDNDWAVAVMAGALAVKKVVYLFEAPGLLKDIHDLRSLIPSVKAAELEAYLPFAQGRMKKKILGAQKAFQLGVTSIYWGDGRIEHPISSALKGKGTVISA